MKSFKDGAGIKARRISAFARLSNQLEKGTKPCKETGNDIPLTDSDVKRIKSEMLTLKERM